MSYGIPGVPMLPPHGPGVSSVPMELPKDVVRIGEQALWSTAQLGIGALLNTTTRLFTTPLGQQGQGFGVGLSYDCYGIAAIIQPVGAAFLNNRDAQTIYNNGILSWDFLQTVIDVAPISLIGAGGGLFGMALDQGGAATQSLINNGAGGLWVYRRYPVSLPSGCASPERRRKLQVCFGRWIPSGYRNRVKLPRFASSFVNPRRKAKRLPFALFA